MTPLSIHNISKTFGQTHALRDVSFEMTAGEILVLLGPSGCGKSTLLSIIAGLETPDQGQVLWEGASLAGIPPHRRGFGLMFQDNALFPHMDVYANVAFGLRMARLPAAPARQRTAEMLALVGLDGFDHRDINTLSGGEQQRVALARALAPQPRLLMLDEPLGSLDRSLRERLIGDLHRILRRLHLTAIYVTHDQQEAFALADRVVVMNAGLVEQIGIPQEVYCAPRSPFVARFLELNNLLPATIQDNAGQRLAVTSIGAFPVETARLGPAQLLIRPDAVQPGAQGPAVLQGTLQEFSFRGSLQRIWLSVNEVSLTFDLPSTAHLPPTGESMAVSFLPAQSLQVFAPDRADETSGSEP